MILVWVITGTLILKDLCETTARPQHGPALFFSNSAIERRELPDKRASASLQNFNWNSIAAHSSIPMKSLQRASDIVFSKSNTF